MAIYIINQEEYKRRQQEDKDVMEHIRKTSPNAIMKALLKWEYHKERSKDHSDGLKILKEFIKYEGKEVEGKILKKVEEKKTMFAEQNKGDVI